MNLLLNFNHEFHANIHSSFVVAQTCARKQLTGQESDQEYCSGLFARAQWHGCNPAKQSSKCAWVATLRELKPAQLAARGNAVKVIKHSLCFMTSTCSVERWLHELSMTELKSRAHHLGVYALSDAVKLNVQCMSGRREGSTMNADDLTTSAAASHAQGVKWQPSEFGLCAQKAYAEFFGERELPARDRLALQVRSDKPRLAPLRLSDDRSLKGQLKAHHQSTAAVVAKASSGAKCDEAQVFVQAAADLVASKAACGSQDHAHPAAPLSPPAEDDDDEAVRAAQLSQKLLADKKRAMELSAKPGKVAKYVHATGAVIGPIDKSQRPKKAAKLTRATDPCLIYYEYFTVCLLLV